MSAKAIWSNVEFDLRWSAGFERLACDQLGSQTSERQPVRPKVDLNNKIRIRKAFYCLASMLSGYLFFSAHFDHGQTYRLD